MIDVLQFCNRKLVTRSKSNVLQVNSFTLQQHHKLSCGRSIGSDLSIGCRNSIVCILLVCNNRQTRPVIENT